jgi:hypothetical protein
MFLTLPVAGSFCISCHVLIKSQSGRCFFKSVGSVDDGHCEKFSNSKVTKGQSESHMNKVKINVINSKRCQRRVNAFGNSLVPKKALSARVVFQFGTRDLKEMSKNGGMVSSK